MDKSLKRNTIIARTLFLGLVLALILQLFRIQVLENKRWTTRSAIRNELRKTYQATRGSVLFSNGSPLALSQLAYGVFVIPDNFDHNSIKSKNITREAFAEDASKILELNKDIILERISNPKLKYIAIAHKIDPEVINKFTDKYPIDLGLWTYEEEAKRVYPNGTLASKIIGFVGKDDNGNDVGRYGIEEYFDGILRGTEGVFEGKRDGENQVIVNEEFENVNSRNGIDITLTIDKGIQAMLEERLWDWLEKLKAKEATAVILEPNTGKILAMADLPTYDPNKYWEGEWINCDPNYGYYLIHEKCNKPVIEEKKTEQKKTEQEVFYPEGYKDRLKQIEEAKKKLEEEEKKLRENNQNEGDKVDEIDPRIATYDEHIREIYRKESLPPAEVYRNSANSYLYEPGSVLKVATLAIAYSHNTLPRDPNFQLGGHDGCMQVVDVELCANNKTPRESETVAEMLQRSDNVGAMRVGETVKTIDFVNTYKNLGLGNTTRVELSGEQSYKIKDPTQWTKVDQATASYGQGSVSFTPLQLANVWNILASNGKSYKPTIISSINDNGQIKEFTPEFLGQALDADAAKDAIYTNAIATSESIQEAKNFYEKYPFSAKTGTANIPDPNNVGYLKDVLNISYLGSAPLENPRFTMLVWFREPRRGADGGEPFSTTTAQAAWLDIAERLVVQMKIPPQQ